MVSFNDSFQFGIGERPQLLVPYTFHIRLTPTFGTNALYKTHPGLEEWHPFTANSLRLGCICDRARFLHFRLDNATDCTRVSLHFFELQSNRKKYTFTLLSSNNNPFETSIEEDNVDDLLHSEGIFEDNYTTVPA